MLTQLINSLPTVLAQIPPMLRPMAQMAINQKLASIHPIQLENFNRDFEALLDGIADRDFGTVGLLMERYHIAANGVLEHIVMRLMGVRVLASRENGVYAENAEFRALGKSDFPTDQNGRPVQHKDF